MICIVEDGGSRINRCSTVGQTLSTLSERVELFCEEFSLISVGNHSQSWFYTLCHTFQSFIDEIHKIDLQTKCSFYFTSHFYVLVCSIT